MRDFLPFIVVGITSGAIYGLAATGLVLTYKTSGVFNFAHGAVAAACAYAFHELRTVRGVPWPVALLLTTVVFAPVLGVVLELVGRRLAALETYRRVVATIGILLAIQGAIQLIFGTTLR